MSLVTSARAKYALNNRTTTSDEDTTIAALILAVDKVIKKWLGRDIESTTYDELYNGSGGPRLILRQYPLIAVARVAGRPTTVLRVTNTSSGNSRATVAISSTALVCVHVASGVVTTTSKTLASYPTLSQLAAQVNAIGSGWSASVADSAYNTWDSTDLLAVQGALGCKDTTAELRIHTEDVADYQVVAARGILTKPGGSPDDMDCGGSWTPGINNYRVVYTAGYATVPEAIQEAAAQWVAQLFWQSKRDPAVVQHSITGQGSESFHVSIPPAPIRALLQGYRASNIHALRGG